MITKNIAEKLIHSIEKDTLTKEEEQMINTYFFSYKTDIDKDIDIILTLTSSSIKRIEKAVELARKKNVPILISGSNYIEKDAMYEDERYYLYAICHGINNIILENKSHNTKENFENSIPILKELNVKKVALVTNSQHMLRALLTLKKIQKDNSIVFYPVASYASIVQKNDWIESKKAKEIIKGEIERLVKYQLIN